MASQTCQSFMSAIITAIDLSTVCTLSKLLELIDLLVIVKYVAVVFCPSEIEMGLLEF